MATATHHAQHAATNTTGTAGTAGPRRRAHRRPGFLMFNRPPRLREALDTTVVPIPAPPIPTTTSRSSLITSLGVPALGFIVMLAIALVQSSLGNGQMAIFVWLGLAMSAVYLLGSVWSVADEFFSNRNLFKRQVAEYRELLADADRTLAFLHEQEQQIRRDIDPPVEELCRRLADPSNPSPRTWERRPHEKDFLRLRFGAGPAKSSVGVSFQPPAKPSDLTKEVEVLIARYSNLAAAPLLVDLKEVGSVGVAGEPDPATNLVTSMLSQLIAHHSPTDVRLMALFPRAHGYAWDWLRWTPHAEPLAGDDVGERALACTPERAQEVLRELQEEMSARERRLTAQGASADPATAMPGPHIVALLDGDSLLTDGLVTESLLSRGPALKVHVIYLARTLPALPASCGAVIQVGNTPDDPVSYRVVGTQERAFGNMDYTTPDLAEGLARALSPIRLEVTDRTNGIPDQVRLLDLLDIDDPATADVASLWKKNGGKEHLRIPIGEGTGETPLYLSLQSGSAEGGPHGIVGGMTGSGKSELLRSIVAAFAITHHPHRLNFVLIDYKGGSAFQGLEDLPHVVGFVTNLDERLAERALVALQSELKERQRRLAEAGVDSVSAYQELHDRNPARKLPPLPNLVLVIDEFAQLKEEVPDFIQGLIGIARVGRSLGVHLLLATQKPSGVVTDEIRANTSYKVCLRVAETQDSTEVIGSPEAALLPRTVPGRAFIQVGSEQITAFQAARITTRYAQQTVHAHVGVEEFDPAATPTQPFKASAPGGMVVKSLGETELQVIVRRIVQEADALGIESLRPPWPPPLPEGVALRDVLPPECVPTAPTSQTAPTPARAAAPPSPYSWPAQPPHGWLATPVGLLDDPARQRQDPFLLKLPEIGHALVYGMARTGKSTFLRTAALSLTLTHSPQDLHIYCLEFGRGALAPLGSLPHCGDVLYPTDIEKVRRFFGDLHENMAERAREIQKAGVFTLAEYRTGPRQAARFPYIVALLDNFTTFRETFFGDNAVLDLDLADRLLGDLTSLLREGQAVGIHFLITADAWQPVSRYPAIVNSLGVRIALKQADSGDYSYVGMRARDDLSLPPGRGFVSGPSPLECQIAMPVLSTQSRDNVDPAVRRSDYVTWLREKLTGQAAGPRPRFDKLQVPVEWMSGEEQTAALEEVCALLRDSSSVAAPLVRQLPETVALDALLAHTAQGAGASEGVGGSGGGGHYVCTPVGVEDSTLRAFMLELRAENPVYLVAGPAQSGRSTLLLTAILGLQRRYTPAEVRMAAVAFRRSPLWRLEGLPHFVGNVARGRDSLGDLLDWMEGELDRRQCAGTGGEGEPPILLVLDDLEEVLMDDLAPTSRLVDLAKRGRTLGLTLLVAGLNQELGRAYDSFSDYLKRDQTGFLLSPNLRDDGEILNLRLPMMTHRAFPAGRGFYARRRAWTVLQVATPQAEGSSLAESLTSWLQGA